VVAQRKFLRSPEWQGILQRLSQAIGTKDIQKTAAYFGLDSFRLDLVLLGHKGLTIENLLRTCHAFNLSPNWVLLNQGEPELSKTSLSHKKIAALAKRVDNGIQRIKDKTAREKLERELNKLLERLNEK